MFQDTHAVRIYARCTYIRTASLDSLAVPEYAQPHKNRVIVFPLKNGHMVYSEGFLH